MRSEGYSTRFVCHSLTHSLTHSFTVADTTLQASVVDRSRHRRSVNDTRESFDSWIFKRKLRSKDMTKSVS